MRHRKKKEAPAALLEAAKMSRIPFAHKATGSSNVKRYTLAEVKKQIDTVEGLMVLGVPSSNIRRQVTQPEPLGLGITKYWADRLIARVHAKWEEDNRTNVGAKRTAAEMRMIRQIQNCQGRRDPNNPNVWLEKPNHHALRGYELLLMKLQGTAAPEQVDINVRFTETMTAVWQRYDLAMLQKLHAQAQAKKRLAAAYVEEHPEAREIIEAEGVTVE